MPRLVLALTLAFGLSACAGVPRPSIEDTLRHVRAACLTLGHRDLDECAEHVQNQAAKVENF